MPWIPNLIFGILAIVAALLGLILPETANRPLPQTIDDIVSWRHEKSQIEAKSGEEEIPDEIPVKSQTTLQHETHI